MYIVYYQIVIVTNNWTIATHILASPTIINEQMTIGKSRCDGLTIQQFENYILKKKMRINVLHISTLMKKKNTEMCLKIQKKKDPELETKINEIAWTWMCARQEY